jgi:hypothetical protein
VILRSEERDPLGLPGAVTTNWLFIARGRRFESASRPGQIPASFDIGYLPDQSCSGRGRATMSDGPFLQSTPATST